MADFLKLLDKKIAEWEKIKGHYEHPDNRIQDYVTFCVSVLRELIELRSYYLAEREALIKKIEKLERKVYYACVPPYLIDYRDVLALLKQEGTKQ